MNRIYREATPEERERHARVRELVRKEFPPVDAPTEPPFRTRVAIAAHRARLASGLTVEDVARIAQVDDIEVIRDIESGSDVPLPLVERVMKSLGLKLKVVTAS
jgi:ribosome-binding protein aMBF1 (putative translation factor)